MSLKSKFTSLILTFVLALGLLVVGVFALKTANFEVGGNIVYNVNGVQMTIEKMELNNLTVADEASKMQKVEVDNETTKAEMQTMFDTWKGLSLASTGEDGEVSIVIRITNIAPEENGKKIAVNVSVDVAEEGKNNCDVVVTNLNGETSTVIAPQQYADFKIAFVPEDDGFQGSINNFVVNFDILRATCSVVVNEEALGTCSVVQSSEGAVFTATPTGTSTYVGLRNTATGKWVDINTMGVEEFNTCLVFQMFEFGDAYMAVIFQDFFVNNASLASNTGVTSLIDSVLNDENSAEDLANYESMFPGLTEILTEIHNGNFTYQDSNANGEYEAVFTNSAQKQNNITVDECTYTIYPDAKVAVLTSTTKTGEVEILSTVTYEDTTYDVIAVGGPFDESGAPTPVFTGDGITKVTLPNSITSVGGYTFMGCTNLAEVVLGDNVNSICYMAFAECSNLAKLTINTIKPCAQGSEYLYTEDSASFGFSTTTEIYVPKEAYFDYVDAWSIYAGQIVAPEGVEVAALAYNYDDTNLTAEVKMLSPTATKGDIVVPETVKHNGQNYTVTAVTDAAFFNVLKWYEDLMAGKITDESQYYNYSAKITSITLPNTVTKIGAMAFGYNNTLSSVSIPDTLEYVGGDAFIDCTSLSKTTYDGVEYLGNTTNPYVLALDVDNSTSTNFSIHENCKGIVKNDGGSSSLNNKTVNLPEGLVFIGDNALSSLNKISKLPSNLKYLGMSNFYYDSSISYTTYGNAYYLGNDANPYWVLMKATSTDVSTIDIHQDCLQIARSAFRGYTNITSVTISNSVKRINDNAFENCTGLTSITIPESVVSIGSEVFSGCSSATFTIGNSIEEIGDYAFKGCTNLSGQLDLRNLKSIGILAFMDCENITSVILSNKLGSAGMYAFGYNYAALTDVYYMGTQKEWEDSYSSPAFDMDGIGLENATKHYNYNPS